MRNQVQLLKTLFQHLPLLIATFLLRLTDPGVIRNGAREEKAGKNTRNPTLGIKWEGIIASEAIFLIINCLRAAEVRLTTHS